MRRLPDRGASPLVHACCNNHGPLSCRSLLNVSRSTGKAKPHDLGRCAGREPATSGYGRRIMREFCLIPRARFNTQGAIKFRFVQNVP